MEAVQPSSPAAVLVLLPLIAMHADFAPKDVALLTCVSREAKEVVEREGVWKSVRLASPDICVDDFQRYALLKQRGVVFMGDVTVWYGVLWDHMLPDPDQPHLGVWRDDEPPFSLHGEFSVSDVLKVFPDATIGARTVALQYYDTDIIDPVTADGISYVDMGLMKLGQVTRFALGEPSKRVFRWTVGSPPTTVASEPQREEIDYY
jgi:hypothetical protein